jgi:hypothetical protein
MVSIRDSIVGSSSALGLDAYMDSIRGSVVESSSADGGGRGCAHPVVMIRND